MIERKKTIRFITDLFLRPYARKRPPSKRVAIVVPMSARAELTPDEEISMRHLMHYLGNYDIYLIAPPGIQFDFEGCKVMRFPEKYFGSAAAHGRLLYAPFFFKAFEDYEYILFYHLDSLAFSDRLLEWCDTGLDYVGPPWLKCDASPWVEKERVGNGGFALLKVESILKVLYNRHRENPSTYWLDMFSRNGRRLRPVIRILEALHLVFPGSRLVRAPLIDWEAMENPEKSMRQVDIFWSDIAFDFLPSFKVASLEEGLRFAFETTPRTCFERNGNEMPFGCHAFARYDRAFWEPHILPAPGEMTYRQEVASASNR